jgi:hypothetical protein
MGIPAAEVLTKISMIVTAEGALGLAACGLVDSLKALPNGGISRAGFKAIEDAITTFTPEIATIEKSSIGRSAILRDLASHWINGTPTPESFSARAYRTKIVSRSQAAVCLRTRFSSSNHCSCTPMCQSRDSQLGNHLGFDWFTDRNLCKIPSR